MEFKSYKSKIDWGFDRFSGLYLWAAFILIFSILTPSLFLSTATLHTIASQQAIAALIALAILVPLTAGVYDLSVGANANLVALFAIVAQVRFGWPMWVSIGAAISVGLVVGAVNGLVVVHLKVDSFIATLGMSSILLALQVIVTENGQPGLPTNPSWQALAGTKVWGFQSVVLFLLAIAVIVWWLLEYTPWGRYLGAIGGNEQAARLSGVRVDAYKWRAMLFSGGLSAIAGVLYGSLIGPSLTFGPAILLPAFAAVFLGATQFKPGRFNVWGTIVAVYALATGVKGLQLMTGLPWLANLFNGVALVAAVSFAGWRVRKRVANRMRNAAIAAVRNESPVLESVDGRK